MNPTYRVETQEIVRKTYVVTAPDPTRAQELAEAGDHDAPPGERVDWVDESVQHLSVLRVYEDGSA